MFESQRVPRDPNKPPPVNGLTVFLVGLALIFGYYQYRQGNLGKDSIIYFVALIPSVIIHEISHGALANVFGDQTAKRAGRLTLNPLRHVDPLGTIILPGLLLLTNNPAFGYAKPVPVNTSRMTRNKAMLVGLVGPFTNFVLVGFAVIALRIVSTHDNVTSNLVDVIYVFGEVNVVLGVFNLIPIPPLDGSSIVERFLPAQYMNGYYRFRQYSIFILMLLALNSQSSLGHLFTPALNWYRDLLPGFLFG